MYFHQDTWIFSTYKRVSPKSLFLFDYFLSLGINMRYLNIYKKKTHTHTKVTPNVREHNVHQFPVFPKHTCVSPPGHTGRLLKSLCFTSLTFLLLHIIYQIVINSLLAGDNIEPNFNCKYQPRWLSETSGLTGQLSKQHRS